MLVTNGHRNFLEKTHKETQLSILHCNSTIIYVRSIFIGLFSAAQCNYMFRFHFISISMCSFDWNIIVNEHPIIVSSLCPILSVRSIHSFILFCVLSLSLSLSLYYILLDSFLSIIIVIVFLWFSSFHHLIDCVSS